VIGRNARFLALLASSGALYGVLSAAELGHAPANWRGVWLLDRDAGASATSGLSPAKVRELLGTTLSLDGGSAALGALPCPSPSFQVSSESNEDFAIDYRIEPAKIGVTANPIRILQVDCKNYAYNIIRLAADRGLLIYEGHFFGAAKRGR
jgi:hypothetical protein